MSWLKNNWFGIPPLFGKRGDAPYYALVRRLFGVRALNVELYKLALVHRSASVVLEDGTAVNNERLEFLGDAVIETVVSEMLFLEYPEANEGFLSKLRSRIVSRHALNEMAVELGLHREIVVHPSGGLGQSRNNICGDAFEALVGALYLDRGYNRTNRILLRTVFGARLDVEALVATEQDFKSRIIEWSQKHRAKVEFHTQENRRHAGRSGLSSSGHFSSSGYSSGHGSAHVSHFETTLLIDGQHRGRGTGHSKKEAEQCAAAEAFNAL